MCAAWLPRAHRVRPSDASCAMWAADSRCRATRGRGRSVERTTCFRSFTRDSCVAPTLRSTGYAASARVAQMRSGSPCIYRSCHGLAHVCRAVSRISRCSGAPSIQLEGLKIKPFCLVTTSRDGSEKSARRDTHLIRCVKPWPARGTIHITPGGDRTGAGSGTVPLGPVRPWVHCE